VIAGSAAAGTIGVVTCVDYHTAGEPFRIVTSPGLTVAGQTVAARRLDAIADPGVNAIRRLLCHEPRGQADMYGCFQVPPDDAGADLGALILSAPRRRSCLATGSAWPLGVGERGPAGAYVWSPGIGFSFSPGSVQ
jgi:proline racemase